MPTAENHALAYNALTAVDASMRVHLLESHGIPTFRVGGTATIGFPEVPAPESLEVQIWVDKQNLDEANRLMEQFDAERDQMPETPWTCACGESNPETFGVCWKCSAPRASVAS